MPPRPTGEYLTRHLLLLQSRGYDVAKVHCVAFGVAIFSDSRGNMRVKEMADTRYRGLQGAFYDNHNGKGETAFEAAYEAAKRIGTKSKYLVDTSE